MITQIGDPLFTNETLDLEPTKTEQPNPKPHAAHPPTTLILRGFLHSNAARKSPSHNNLARTRVKVENERKQKNTSALWRAALPNTTLFGHLGAFPPRQI